MTMKLELVPVPVSDVDRARAFYVERAGFNLDHDVEPGNGMRIIQLTPPGSACSIVIGRGMPEVSEMTPGSVKGLHLVMTDIARAREEMVGRGVEVGEVTDMGASCTPTSEFPTATRGCCSNSPSANPESSSHPITT